MDSHPLHRPKLGRELALDLGQKPAQTANRSMDGSVNRAQGSVNSLVTANARSRLSLILSLRSVRAGWMKRLLTCGRWGFVAAVALGAACASTPRGATSANFAKARSRSPNGWASFKQHAPAGTRAARPQR